MLKQLILAFATLASFASYVGAQSISCQPLTTTELELKLESFDGYNKRYQAITSKDTENFPILLNQPAAVKLPGVYISFLALHISQVSQNEALSTKMATIACAPSGQRSPRFHPIIFPRYLNEVICDKKDNGCLGHEGACIQGRFVVNVLKNTGVCGADRKETWQLVSQFVRSCCSCRLYQGSSLSGLL